MSPVRFVFGLHLHQPTGNFDHVIKEHVDLVYRPILRFVEERGLTPIALHVSGPLLEWLRARDPRLHDRIGRLVDDGSVELLTSGFYEPILAALTRADRADQLAWMGEYLQSAFGVSPRVAWLTERVFESELIPELVEAGVEALLVDDWHLLAGGIAGDALHGHYRTEANGQALTLVPIHERLRYIVPFQPAAALRDYFLALRSGGAQLAVLGDDGEKFGGWPGTRKRVWDDGWIEEFASVLTELRDDGVLEFSTVENAVAALPCQGLAYVPTASYREMGEWALPPELADGIHHPFQSAPWKNFLVRYEEANRMHKKSLALSRLSRAAGAPLEVQRAIGAAQSNDPYWHGVFGGIYMKHLRDAAWRSLAFAEAWLRRGEGLAVDVGDFDFDGEEELWIHGPRCSAQVGKRSGRIKELVHFDGGVNFADVLTRRWEAYHDAAVERGRERAATVSTSESPGPGEEQERADGGGGRADFPAGVGSPTNGEVEGVEAAPSIHDLEDSYVLHEAPHVDRHARSLVVERVVDGAVGRDAWAAGEYEALWLWPPDSYIDHRVAVDRVVIDFSADWIHKTLTVTDEGGVVVRYRWDGSGFPPSALLAVEISAAHPLRVSAAPEGEVWTYPVVTVPRSERGFERIVQGESTTLLWPLDSGGASVELVAPGHEEGWKRGTP